MANEYWPMRCVVDCPLKNICAGMGVAEINIHLEVCGRKGFNANNWMVKKKVLI